MSLKHTNPDLENPKRKLEELKRKTLDISNLNIDSIDSFFLDPIEFSNSIDSVSVIIEITEDIIAFLASYPYMDYKEVKLLDGIIEDINSIIWKAEAITQALKNESNESKFIKFEDKFKEISELVNSYEKEISKKLPTILIKLIELLAKNKNIRKDIISFVESIKTQIETRLKEIKKNQN